MISKKKQKGVTLISLIITIIILIILTSISIKVLLGEDGLITNAKEAKKAQKISEIKERISLEITSAKAEALLRNEELEKAQVKDIIEPKYGTLKEDGNTIITKEGNYEISLEEIYYGALSESGSYSAKVEQVEMLEQELSNFRQYYGNLKNVNNIYSYSSYAPGNDQKADTSCNSFTVDVKTKYAEYSKLTKDNFYFICTEIYGRADSGNDHEVTGKINPVVSYDNSSGILTVSGLVYAYCHKWEERY